MEIALKKPRKFLEKHGSSAHISLISLSKSDRFSKTHIYSERGNFGTSSYDKNSTSIFFQKIGFSEGGAPLKQGRNRSWLLIKFAVIHLNTDSLLFNIRVEHSVFVLAFGL